MDSLVTVVNQPDKNWQIPSLIELKSHVLEISPSENSEKQPEFSLFKNRNLHNDFLFSLFVSRDQDFS